MTTQQRNAQRFAALESANEVRFRNSSLKMGIRTSCVDPLTVITERSEGIRAFDVLRSIPGIGPTKADKFLRAAGIDRRKRIDHLTGRQAQVLASCVMDRINRLEAA